MELWGQQLLAEGKSPATVRAYLGDIERYGGTPLSCSPERARAIRDSGLAPRTIARHLASHAAWARHTYPSQEKWFLARPSVGVVTPHVVPLPEEMRRFIAAETDPQWRALWALMCGAGLRVSEAVAVRSEHICIDPMKVRVLGKGSKVRDIPLSAEVSGYVLAAWPQSPMFPWSVRTVQRRVKVIAVKAGLPGTWHPHALRHGFATAAWSSTGDLRTVGDLLGHASISTTMIYTHVNDERRTVAVAGIL